MTAPLATATPGEILAMLETLASEHPAMVRPAVATLANSPARLALLELVPLFQVEAPAEIVGAAVTVARQLDRLEIRPNWTDPRDILGDASASPTVLDAFARTRADRWRSRHGTIRPPRLARVDRRLKKAAGLERARALVDGFLSD